MNIDHISVGRKLWNKITNQHCHVIKVNKTNVRVRYSNGLEMSEPPNRLTDAIMPSQEAIKTGDKVQLRVSVNTAPKGALGTVTGIEGHGANLRVQIEGDNAVNFNWLISRKDLLLWREPTFPAEIEVVDLREKNEALRRLLTRAYNSMKGESNRNTDLVPPLFSELLRDIEAEIGVQP